MSISFRRLVLHTDNSATQTSRVNPFARHVYINLLSTLYTSLFDLVTHLLCLKCARTRPLLLRQSLGCSVLASQCEETRSPLCLLLRFVSKSSTAVWLYSLCILSREAAVNTMASKQNVKPLSDIKKSLGLSREESYAG